MPITREDAWKLLNDYTKKESLVKHALAVESAMRMYAKKFGEDEEAWGITGLLHDFDYDAFPDPNNGGHPYKGNAILKGKGLPDEICTAIMGHADYTNTPRETKMAKALYAADEICGFIMAVAYVRPDKLNGISPKSVKKKLKDKAFAAAINREEISHGIEALGVDRDEHIQTVITAMQGIANELGF